MKKAVGYIRVSTEEQAADDRYGISAQRQEIEAYASARGYEIAEWKIDKMSGAKDDRPAMNDILFGDEVMNPPYSAVIAFKSDRIARDTKLYFYYLYTLERKNIKLLCVTEDFVEGSEFANIYRALLQFVAEQERKNIAMRTSNGRSIKASCGGYGGGRPAYGYGASNKSLIVIKSESDIVLKIFAKHREGMPIARIADYLSDIGVRNRAGTRFTATDVRRIILNEPLYRGKYKYGKMEEWVQGVHEAILTD